MCRITGIFDTRSGRPIKRAQLQRMNDSQFHRGPDEGSLHLEPGLGLGHRRLSIIDIATGQQLLFNEDGSVVVVFNGEIYNYQSLVPELLARSHVVHTKSDTEVMAHAWDACGENYAAESVEVFENSGFSVVVTMAMGAADHVTDPHQLTRFTTWDRNRMRFGQRLAANLMCKRPVEQ